MSANTIERVLWDLGDDRAKLDSYLKDPDAYLDQFPLDGEERRMIRTMDVKALEAHGVSNMLIMLAFQNVKGGNPLLIFELLKRLNGGKRVNRMRVPAVPFALIHAVLGVQNAWAGLLVMLGLRKRVG